MPPTESQMRALTIIPMVMGPLSMACSVTVICIILRSHVCLKSTYHRLATGLSFCDFFQSLSHALSSIPVPKETGILFAMGNQATCNFQGFIFVFGASSLMFYFCGLTGYFVMTIKLGIDDDVIAKYYEPIVHAFSLGYGLFGATFTLLYMGYMSSGSLCWIAPNPINCNLKPAIDCTSGSNFFLIRWIFLAGPAVLSFCIIFINMVTIFFTLYSQNKESHITLGNSPDEEVANQEADDQGTLQGRRGVERRSSVIELYAASKQNKKRSKAEKDRREGMTQALLYIGAFFLCYIFNFIYHNLAAVRKRDLIDFFILGKTFNPLQGFFVFFIFIRPRVVNIWRQHPSYSFFRVFKAAILSRGERVQKPRRNFAKLKRRALASTTKKRETDCIAALPKESNDISLLSELPIGILDSDEESLPRININVPIRK